MTSSPHFDIDQTPVVPPRVVPTFGCGGRVRIEALIAPSPSLSEVDQEPSKFENQIVTVCGWSKTVRKQGGAGLVFIALSDGSTSQTLQVVVSASAVDEATYATLQKCGVSCSFRVSGLLAPSPAKGQRYELQVNDKDLHSIKVYGEADQARYPLAKKAHSKEFLREIQHLRARSYMMGTVMRVRSALAAATHEFFQSRGFVYIHTPIITCSDCEGAGEMFQVTTLIPESDDPAKLPVDPATKKLVYKNDFFGRKAMLTVSGQLNVETYATALSDCYTFGPTFRAEMSHTSRHLAEFWMIEPEMAFADLDDNMRCAEAYLRFCVQYVLERHPADLEWLEKNVETGLLGRLHNISESKFARITYTEAITILEGQPPDRFQIKPFWGIDMGSEHERFLAEEHFRKPVIVTDYPYDLKAFYMKVNEDKKTVRAMDILVPKIGEVCGGSQREENLDLLDKQIADKGLDKADYWWYRDLRKFGTVPHSGFGVGFERLIMLVTGIENIRDVIPFPRAAGTADF